MSKVNIQPQPLGLNMGEVHSIQTRVNHTIGSTSVVLEVDLFDAGGFSILPSPRLIPVPQETLTAWGFDFSPVTAFVLNELGAEPL